MIAVAEGDAAADPGDEAVELSHAVELGEEIRATGSAGGEARSIAHEHGGGFSGRERASQRHPQRLPDLRGADGHAVHARAQVLERAQLGRHGVELEAVDGPAAGVAQGDGGLHVHPARVPVEVKADGVAGLKVVAGRGRDRCGGHERGKHDEDEDSNCGTRAAEACAGVDHDSTVPPLRRICDASGAVVRSGALLAICLVPAVNDRPRECPYTSGCTTWWYGCPTP